MTVNDVADVIATLKKSAPKAVKTVSETVCDLKDSQVDPDTLDARVEAAMFDELLPGLFALVKVPQ